MHVSGDVPEFDLNLSLNLFIPAFDIGVVYHCDELIFLSGHVALPLGENTRDNGLDGFVRVN